MSLCASIRGTLGLSACFAISMTLALVATSYTGIAVKDITTKKEKAKEVGDTGQSFKMALRMHQLSFVDKV